MRLPKVFELLLNEKSICLTCAKTETHIFRLTLEERSILSGPVVKGEAVCLDLRSKRRKERKDKTIYVNPC